jgi:outer membrane scaffolding protein for murein synthesis (MipA/OmpV family)
MAAVCGLVLSGWAGFALAEPITVFGYDLDASLRAQVAPSYEGGKTYAVFPGGSLAIAKPWEFDAYSAPDDAASFAIINTKNIAFGPAASVRVARGNEDELRGFKNIGWSLEGGGFVNFWPTKFMRLHGEVLRGLTAQQGIEVNSGLDFLIRPKTWTLGFGPRFSWADNGFNDTYFGVTRAEALASPYGLHFYNPKQGPRFAGLETTAEYKWFSRLRLTADASYHRMLSQDANSPLVRRLGDANQFAASLGVRWMLTD